MKPTARDLAIFIIIMLLSALSACYNPPRDNPNDERGETYPLNNNPGDTPSFTAGEKLAFDVNEVSFKMAYVPGKRFYIWENDASYSVIPNDYWIGETEVSFELWIEVYDWAVSNGYTFANMGSNGSGASSDQQYPVTNVNWRDAMVWCNALTEFYNAHNEADADFDCVYYTDQAYKTPIRSSSDGDYGSSINSEAGSFDNPYIKDGADGFRLPVCDEWELAARYIKNSNNDGDIMDEGEYYPGNYASGADAQFDTATCDSDIDGDGDKDCTDDVAVHSGNALSAALVKSKHPNALGLYDMSGNVLEWCFDKYTYPGDNRRINRGGSYLLNASYLKLHLSFLNKPYEKICDLGFRLARSNP